MEDVERVAKHWPHLAALTAVLEDLTSRTHVVAVRRGGEALDVELRHRETMAAPIAP